MSNRQISLQVTIASAFSTLAVHLYKGVSVMQLRQKEKARQRKPGVLSLKLKPSRFMFQADFYVILFLSANISITTKQR